MSTRFPWGEIRAQYESGATIRDLIGEYHCGRRSIELHARSGNWKRPLNWKPTVAGNGCGIGRGGDYATVPLTAGEVLERHKRDWEELRPLHAEAVKIARTAQDERALRAARLVRTLVDGLKELQSGERLAWAIAPGDAPPEVDDATLEAEIAKASERIAQQRHDSGDGHTLH